MALDQRERIAIDLRNVEENWLGWYARRHSDQERLSHISICSEERADLVTGPAWPHHHVAVYPCGIHCREGLSSRPLYPMSQEFAAWRGKVSSIVGIEAIEGKRRALMTPFRCGKS